MMKRFTITVLVLTLLSFNTKAQLWTETSSSLFGARINSTATLLNDGRVFIVGGQFDGESDVTVTVEIFNPVLDTYSQVADIPSSAIGHTTVCSSDSTIIVFGGFIGSGITTNAVYEYNINTDIWTQKSNLPLAIGEHTATVLNDNRVLIMGWQISGSADNPYAFTYNPITDTYSDYINLIDTRCGHTATLLNNGMVLIAGGYCYATSTAITHCELFDPETESWIDAGTIPAGRTGGQAAVKTYNGDVFVFGGYNFYGSGYVPNIDKYDAQTNSWSTIANLSPTKSNLNAVLLPDSNILISSGFHDSFYYSDAIILNPLTGDQTTITALPEARSKAQTLRLRDNRILLMNGKESSSAYHDNGLLYGSSTAIETYSVTFFITEIDGTTPIEMASIEFNSQIFQTDINGELTFEDIEISNGIPFEVEKLNYANYTGSVSVQQNNIEIHVSLDQTTSIKNNQMLDNISIYPNPSNGQFKIEGKGIQKIEIVDITGKTIYNFIASGHTERSRSEAKKQSLNLSNSPKGIYFAKITTIKGIITEKIIIQ